MDEAEEKRRKVFAGLIWKRLEIDVLWVGYLSAMCIIVLILLRAVETGR